ncbi:hypothetical protein [Rhodococcus indonesiensis]
MNERAPAHTAANAAERATVEALIDGQRRPATLADLATGTMRGKRDYPSIMLCNSILDKPAYCRPWGMRRRRLRC